MPALERTALVIETSRRHVSAIPNDSADKALISAYLAGIACVIFYSEMEERVRDVLKKRLAVGGDTKLATFLFKTNEGILKRIKKTDIAETVSLFGEEMKGLLNERIAPDKVEKYSNVILKRHNTSHGPGLDVTLMEVEEAMQIAEEMLVLLAEIIA